MIKKIITAIIFTALFMNMSVPAFAYNYTFSSGADSKTIFDKSTQTDEITAQDPLSENIRRNKDTAYNPPTYGIFSGDIPTDPSSLYHTQDKSNAVATSSQSVTYSSYLSDNIADLPPISNISSEDILPSTSVYSNTPMQTLPQYYSDGSIGTLEFPRFGKTIKVYEGTSLSNMSLGAGHFSETSAWNGNVCVAAHNRGVPNNFIFLKDMIVGDKVTYTTKYGQRTYEVISNTQISVNDTSGLAWSTTNILSLYTCVQNVPNLRILVVCREIV